MEKAHLTGALQRNGYPAAFVRVVSRERKPRECDPEEVQGEGKPTLMKLPYVAGVSERIRKSCRNYSIRVVLRSGPTFRSMLTKVKDPLAVEKQANVVYEIPCMCGKVYIGETKRRLGTRLKEHKDACVKGQTDKSAIAEHAWTIPSTVSDGDSKTMSMLQKELPYGTDPDLQVKKLDCVRHVQK